MLDRIQLSNNTIKEVTYSYFNLTVYTESETYYLPLYAPIIFAIVGIVYNLVYYFIHYLKDKQKTLS